jgi:hypothetical protein
MKTTLLHQRAIELLELYDKEFAKKIELEDHIENYGKKYFEIQPKSKLEHDLEISQNSLKRIASRYETLLSDITTRQSIFYKEIPQELIH